MLQYEHFQIYNMILKIYQPKENDLGNPLFNNPIQETYMHMIDTDIHK